MRRALIMFLAFTLIGASGTMAMHAEAHGAAQAHESRQDGMDALHERAGASDTGSECCDAGAGAPCLLDIAIVSNCTMSTDQAGPRSTDRRPAPFHFDLSGAVPTGPPKI